MDQYSSGFLAYNALNKIWIRETDAAGNVSIVDPMAPTIAIQYTAPVAPISVALTVDSGAGVDSGQADLTGMAPLVTVNAPYSNDHITNTPQITLTGIDPTATKVEYVINQVGGANGTWASFLTMPTNGTPVLLDPNTGTPLLDGQYDVAIDQVVGGVKSAITHIAMTIDATAPTHGVGNAAYGGVNAQALTDASELFLPANGSAAAAVAVFRVTYNEAVFGIGTNATSAFQNHLLQAVDPLAPALTPVTLGYTVQIVNSGMSMDGTTVLGVRPNGANPSGVEDVVEIRFTETTPGTFGQWTGPTTATTKSWPCSAKVPLARKRFSNPFLRTIGDSSV